MKRADMHKFPWTGDCICTCWKCGAKWTAKLTLMLPRPPIRRPSVQAMCDACIARNASPTLLAEWRKANAE